MHKNKEVSLYFERDNKHEGHSPLKHFKVDLRIGDQTRGQVANALKVEQFGVTALKKKLVEALVYPKRVVLFDGTKEKLAKETGKGL